jgi:Protein-arginine deiminase (PAD)
MPDYEIHADYDRDGTISLSAREYALRSNGIDVIPNLDRDDLTLPVLSPNSTLPRDIALDWEPPAKRSVDDDPVRIVILRRTSSAGPTTRVLLRFPVSLASSLRVYDVSRNRITPNRVGDFQQVPITGFRNDRSELCLEVSVVAFGPAISSDEIPISLVVEDGAQSTEVDTTRLIIRPLKISADTAPPVTLFIADVPEMNTSTVQEAEAYARAARVPLVKVPLSLNQGDVWLQDQIQFSSLRKGRTWVPFVIHLPRMTSAMSVDVLFDNIETLGPNLEQFVDWYFRARDVAICRDLYSVTFTCETLAGPSRQEQLDIHEAYIAFLQLGRIFVIQDRLSTILVQLTGRAIDRPSRLLQALNNIPDLISQIETLRTRQGAAASDNLIFVLFERLVRNSNALHQRIVRSAGQVGLRIVIQRRSGALPATRREIVIALANAQQLWERVNSTLNSLNYGGNIEVSPPFVPSGQGKLVTGLDGYRPMGEALQNLLSQSEPARTTEVVLLDTSWLEVGHVDEIITFVPRRGANPPFAILISSPGLGIEILSEAFAYYRSGVTQPSAGEWLANHPYVPPSASMTAPRPTPYYIDGIPFYNLPTRDVTTREGAHPITRLFRGKAYERERDRDGIASYRVPEYFDQMMLRLRANNQYLYEMRQTSVSPSNPLSPIHSYFSVEKTHYRAKMSVRTVLQGDQPATARQGAGLPEGSSVTNGSSLRLQRQTLDPIVEQLAQNFRGMELFHLPVLFDLGEKTTAFTPDLVNLQQLNEHIMIPRPFGPRMSASDAITVVQRVVTRRNRGSLPPQYATRRLERLIQREHLDVTIHWANSFIDGSAQDLADEFGDGFPSNLSAADLARQIVVANPGKFLANGNLRSGWQRVLIPEHKVDLFELYTHAILDDFGLRVYWVDSWYYHTRLGGLHCGTNVMRRS